MRYRIFSHEEKAWRVAETAWTEQMLQKTPARLQTWLQLSNLRRCLRMTHPDTLRSAAWCFTVLAPCLEYPQWNIRFVLFWLVSLTSGGAKNNAHAKRACWVWQERRSSFVQTGKLDRCVNQRKRNIINILWSHRGPLSPFNGVNLRLARSALVDFLALLPRNNEVRRGEAVPDTGCTQLALLETFEWNSALSAWKKSFMSAQHQEPALIVTCWP